MASNLSHGMKRVLAGVLSLLVVAGNMGLPSNVRGGGLFAKNAIVASAATYSGNIETSTTLQAGDILEPGAMYMADGKTYVLQANGYCTEEHGIYTQGTTNRTLDNLMELNVSRQSDTLGAIGRMPDCYYPYADGAKVDAWVVVSVQSDGNEPWQPQTITLKGYAEPGPFTVTYAANDATSGAVPTDSDSHDKSSEVTVLGNTGNLEKTGCTFVGWKDQSGNIYKAGEKFAITKNTTLSAVWAGSLVGTEVKKGDSIDLTGKYYAYSNVSTANELTNVTLSNFNYYYNSWSFFFDDSEMAGFMISGDETPAPIGFKVVSGEGTYENPYSFALLYEQSASNDAITYLTATWNESTQKVVYTEATASTYTEVASDTTAWSTGTYVVNSNVTISSRITVNGTVNLILCDGAKLTASKGITVNEGNTLNIYGQAGGTGTLTATGAQYCAAIGGYGDFSMNTAETCGTVNIYGGTVNATGNTGVGIGGGSGRSTGGNGGNVIVYGGIVTATGQYAAGIGGGTASMSGGNGGNVTIYGGTVNANGGQNGEQWCFGIGGGYGMNVQQYGDNGTLTLGAGLALQNSTNNSTWTTVEASNGDYTRAQYMRTVKPTVTSAPTPISGLTYSESELTLVQEGTAENGTMQYALGTNATTAPTTGWSTSIPTGTDAGTYYVWYKAVNGSAESEAGCVTVKIKAKNSFTTTAVANSWLQYDGNPKNLLYTVPVAAEGTVQYKVDDGDWSATPPTATDAGNYTVYIKAPATDNYAEYIDRVVVSISKGQMTVNPPTAANSAYTGGAVDLLSTLPSIVKGNTTDSVLYAVTGADGNPSSSDFSTSEPTATAVGNYIVWYKVAGNDNYNDYSDYIGASITNATLTGITAENYTGTYNGQPHGITLTGVPTDATISYRTSASGEYNLTSNPTFTDVGTYTVYYKVTKDNYYDETGSATVTINKATPSITLENDQTYNGSAKPLISSVSYAGGTTLFLCVKDANDTSPQMAWTRYEDASSLTDNSFKRTDAGTYNVYYYNERTAPTDITEGTLVGSVTISNGTLSGIIATGYNDTYDGTAHTITVNAPEGATVKYCLTESGDYQTDPITFTDATDGEQTVYYKVEKANYNTVSGSATVNISKAALTVTAKPKTITYGDAPANNGVEYSGFVNNETSAALVGTLGYTYSYTQYGDVTSATLNG